ncbi:MAG TPA: hypothetical protein VFU10_06195 [Gaiellaceae bacterium]|nr:hypothetical protein [Gaiellaceae bacterium]
MYGSRIIRVSAILGVLAAAFAGNAHAQALRVVVVPGLQAHDLRTIAPRAAVGLLVPGAGPETSARAAAASLARGVVRNSLRGATPSGPVRIRIAQSRSIPNGGGFIVVGLPQGGAQPNDRRYGIAVVAAGFRGLLTSPSTRIPGLVSVADVAPTALGESGKLGSQEEGDPLTALEALDRRIRDGNSWRTRTTTWLEVAIGVLAVVSGTAAVVGVAAMLLANLLAGALGIGTGGGAAFLLAGAACGLAAAWRRPRGGALAALMAGVLAAYLVSFELDERWVALSPLGPSQNARFYGISNLLETFMLVPALVGAALLRRRPWAAGGLALLAFVTIAGSRFGADGGGAIVLGVGYAVLVALLTGAGRRTLVAAVAAGVAVVLGLLALDAATGASSHVTRALRKGPDGLATDLWNRITLSWDHLTANTGTIVATVVALVILAALVARVLALRLPAALPLALAAAIAASMVVNDSPKEVAVAGAVLYAAVEAFALGPRSAAGLISGTVTRKGTVPTRARRDSEPSGQPPPGTVP